MIARNYGLGLRAQILLALGAAFAASFLLLSVAATAITKRAREVDLERGARAAAHALLSTTASERDLAGLERDLRAFVQRAGVDGASLRIDGVGTARAGRREGAATAIVSLGASQAKVWTHASGSGSQGMARLFLLYVALTAVVISFLAFVVLTRLIVRPVESVTRAAERLAEGRTAPVPVSGAAEVMRLAVAFNEMSAQLKAERAKLEARLRELEKATRALRAANEGVARSEKLASVGRLAAGVAHEIGNPLAAILGLLELLRDGGLEPSEQREFIVRIQKETERIHRIIRDLLDFSRQDAPAVAEATADLVEVVEEAVALVAPQRDLRSVTLERRFAEEVPRVRGAPHQLTQIVLNLLLNAADAIGGEGAVTIEVEPDESERFVHLVVQDTGPGIAPDVLDKIFEPFVTTKPAGEGTGLGLAVCLTIVEALGGTIRASNPPSGGARFEVILPVPRSSLSSVPPRADA